MKIILANGTELNEITEDNGVFASQTEITDEMLNDAALETVTVVDDEGAETVLRYAKYDTIYRVGDEWHFVLVGANDAEIQVKDLESENAMLTECILEMSEIIYAE